LKSVLKALARFHADGIAFLRKNSEAKYPFLQVTGAFLQVTGTFLQVAGTFL
jgi:hypothetical protein